jgi:hypothetical protein
MSVAEFKSFVHDELEVNRKIVQAAGIKAQ